MKITLRKVAKLQGLSHYFTGKPCKYGHLSKRLTLDGGCLECCRIKGKNRRLDNFDRVNEISRNWILRNPEKIKARDKKRYAENRESEIQRRRDHRIANLDDQLNKRRIRYYKNKTEELKAAKEWKYKNKPRLAALEMKRRAAKLNRTPSWLNQSDLDIIVDIHVIAARVSKETGVKHQVDHVIPLQGKLVSGLHVSNNLQLLTAKANLSKGNNFAVI